MGEAKRRSHKTFDGGLSALAGDKSEGAKLLLTQLRP